MKPGPLWTRPATHPARVGVVQRALDPRLGQVDASDAAVVRAAQLTVADHALDVADCRGLLEMLGLIEAAA